MLLSIIELTLGATTPPIRYRAGVVLLGSTLFLGRRHETLVIVTPDKERLSLCNTLGTVGHYYHTP